MAVKKSENKAIGLTRGGINTKIHAVVDGLGNPVEFLLSPGNGHDSIHAIKLLNKVDLLDSHVLADRAYGTSEIRNYIEIRQAAYVIPPKRNSLNPWECDWCRYKEPHLVECFFQKIKWFRRVSSRYEKHDDSFLPFIYLAAIAILLK